MDKTSTEIYRVVVGCIIDRYGHSLPIHGDGWDVVWGMSHDWDRFNAGFETAVFNSINFHPHPPVKNLRWLIRGQHRAK